MDTENTLISSIITQLYRQYIESFSRLDINAVKQCYVLPCTLSTPDKVVLLDNESTFEQEFSDIFNMLKQENITGFKTSNASFSQINDNLVVVNVDWQFLQQANNLFTEFTAIYHLTKCNDEFKIATVISQDINQAISLEHSLTINVENN